MNTTPVLQSIGAAIDALGRPVTLADAPRRIVSLVPSLTEALFGFGLREQIAGITRYCIEPAELVAGVPTVGGTKNPEIDHIVALEPDLVVASAEENIRDHVEQLIGQGLTVYVSLPETVSRALDELDDLARLVHRPGAAAAWTDGARDLLADLGQRAAVPASYFCPIWRRPWMVAGPDTYMTDLLARCGGNNVFGQGPARYFAVDLADALARDPAVVLLPSEPYPFAEKHRQEVLAFQGNLPGDGQRVHLIDGQLLTWYGPRIPAALRAFSTIFESAGGLA